MEVIQVLLNLVGKLMQNILQDSISRLQNGQKYLFLEVELISSKTVLSFLKLLYQKGFIRGFKKEKKNVIVYLKYFNNKPAISFIQAVSTKNCRLFMSYSDLIKCSNLKETLIILTPEGFITSKDLFLSNFLGGEVVCKIF